MLSAREQRRTATVGQKEEPMRAFVQDEKGRPHSSWTFPFPSGAISSWMPVGQASSSVPRERTLFLFFCSSAGEISLDSIDLNAC